MDTRTTLLTALPLVLIMTVLAAIIVLSSNPNFRLDIRPRASTLPTIQSVTPLQLQPETVCTSLYQPVCGKDNRTYENTCDARNHNATIAYYTACAQPRSKTTPSPTSYQLPVAQ